MFKIGFMQGRLTNKGDFFPQQFPWENWEKEFLIAGEMGFDSLEWMFNEERWKENPIFIDEGIECIRKEIMRTNVSVSGICANFFMRRSIYDSSAVNQRHYLEVLQTLINNAEKIGCHNIILPMFDASGEAFIKREVWDNICHILEKLVFKDVSILFETDAPMEIVQEYLRCASFKNVGVCYDLGNAAGLGKDILFEQKKYADIIGEFHVKDKAYKGNTVILGQGDVPYTECINQMLSNGYNGYVILESYYSKDAIGDTLRNLQFIKDKIER